ncbi:MAG TPA: hypothetical protein VGM37_02385 [Armatimonadota bacterium]|jgi:hypothetical protein
MNPTEKPVGIDLADAVVLGQQAIVGAGAFVALAAAADLAGPWAIPAVAVAGVLAAATGLSLVRDPSLVEPSSARVAETAALAAAAGVLACAAAAYLAPDSGGLAGRCIPAALILAVGALRVAFGRLSRPAAGVFLALTMGGLAFFVGSALPLLKLSAFPPAPGRPVVGAMAACGLLALAFSGFGHLVARRHELEPGYTARNAVLLAVLPLAVIYILVVLGGFGVVLTARPMLYGASGALVAGGGTWQTSGFAPLVLAAAWTYHPAVRWAVRLAAVAACGGGLYTLLGDASGEPVQPARLGGVGLAAAALTLIVPAGGLLRLAALAVLARHAIVHGLDAQRGSRASAALAAMYIVLFGALAWSSVGSSMARGW